MRYYFFSILNNWEVGSGKWSRLIGITSYFLLLTFYVGCAPKVAPPSLYKDIDLTLDEIIAIASKDVETLKVIVAVATEKDNNTYTYVDASVLLKRPNWLHIRLYTLGIPVGNFLVKDGVVYNLSGKGNNKLNEKLVINLREFSRNLYLSIFWWDGLENSVMYKDEREYIIRAENREIHLDNLTLLPKSQELIVRDKKIYILYEEPKKAGDFWYSSNLKVEAGNYRFSIKIEKLFVNPLLEENDFKENI
ncbi:MAG: hypothetical protein HY752_05505 [Nitrospirae bacterium]|nr:hypothetical protein [Nitrospirota bacterium]